MLSEKTITEALLQCQRQQQKVQELSRLLAEWDSSLQRRAAFLENVRLGLQDIAEGRWVYDKDITAAHAERSIQSHDA